MSPERPTGLKKTPRESSERSEWGVTWKERFEDRRPGEKSLRPDCLSLTAFAGVELVFVCMARLKWRHRRATPRVAGGPSSAGSSLRSRTQLPCQVIVPQDAFPLESS